MFVIKGKAELKNINIRVQAHGDELVRAMDLKLAMEDADPARLDSAVSDLTDRFWNKDEPLVQEIYPLRVGHKLENCAVELSDGKVKVKLNGADVKKIEITPHHGRRVGMVYTVQAIEIQDGILDTLHKWLRGVITVDVVERQMELPDMEQVKG